VKKILISSQSEKAAEQFGMKVLPGTEFPKSLLFVPLVSGDKAKSYVSLQNIDEEHAFNESDVRLLETLANSMSVALENARLFDETQRLLKLTENRNAELAVINSIQEGVAAELDFQTIIDLVGDKLREVFNIGDLGIRWYDAEADLIHYYYEYEHGERLSFPPVHPGNSPTWIKLNQSRQPLVLRNQKDYLEQLGTNFYRELISQSAS
jgi:GAF domain-containing protein